MWVILQDTANGLLRLRNPYEMRFPDVPPGETSSCFNYLPTTFLLTAPGRWLFGLPCTLLVVRQAWTEPMLSSALCATDAHAAAPACCSAAGWYCPLSTC